MNIEKIRIKKMKKANKTYICICCEEYPANPTNHICGYKYLKEIGEYYNEQE